MWYYGRNKKLSDSIDYIIIVSRTQPLFICKNNNTIRKI